MSDAITAARQLLGYKLVSLFPEGRCSGYIVETEAYTMDDAASHSFRGQTLRNSAMFAGAGTVYVYFTYGMHYCINIVCGPVGSGEAVLIRALEPVEGIDLMKKRRKITDLAKLTSGPAKLTQALGVNKIQNGTHISTGPIFLEDGVKPKLISTSYRMGITKAINNPWRFFVANNAFVSK